MPDLKNITVNGIPLEKLISEDVVREFKTTHYETVSALNFVKALHTISKFGNTSHARSSRGRVIYSREVIR